MLVLSTANGILLRRQTFGLFNWIVIGHTRTRQLIVSANNNPAEQNKSPHLQWKASYCPLELSSVPVISADVFLPENLVFIS